MGVFARGMEAGDYMMSDSVCFWKMYGCCAPDLKQVALVLTPLGCGSGCAQRDWATCKKALNKERNCPGKDWVEEAVSVRPWLSLQQVLRVKRSQ